uniref:BTB domain-containing protein n=1 Tax=Leersia perrieri TaxID=77586 RepID=A0A0D9WT20_9ORYZ
MNQTIYVGGRRVDNPEQVALQLVFLTKDHDGYCLKASLICRLIDPTGVLDPSQERSLPYMTFNSALDRGCTSPLLLGTASEIAGLGYLKEDSLIVECTIAVFKELPKPVISAAAVKELAHAPEPSSDLHKHLGELLQKETATDVTFVVSGESFAAHKLILAARSPVFMAEFFGHMKEATSGSVVVDDIEPAVFKAMIHFIYTDTLPELDKEESMTTMAMHLLAAADRYGLDRLKLICESKLSGGIDVDTVATTLVLAEQHGCSLLKAKCVEFIIRSNTCKSQGLFGGVEVRSDRGCRVTRLTKDDTRWRGHRVGVVRDGLRKIGKRALGDQGDRHIKIRRVVHHRRRRIRLVDQLLPLRLLQQHNLLLYHAAIRPLIRVSDGAVPKCRLVDQSSSASSSATTPKKFKDVTLLTDKFSKGKQRDMYLVSRNDACVTEFVKDDALLIELTITILLDAPEVAAAPPSPPPLSDMQNHFGELLASKVGADVTFLTSAHRCVLVARSPVFMAEFFGDMKEKDLLCIEIKDMDANELLHFIYTHTLPEKEDGGEGDGEDQTAMAYDLLEAADRYGMERLKLICAEKLQADVDVDNVATALILAERHGCTKLKARCMQFMTMTRDTNHAVAKTEGYETLMKNCPNVMHEFIVDYFMTDKPRALDLAARTSRSPLAMNNAAAAVNLTRAARRVQLFRVNGHSATRSKPVVASCTIAVGGFLWSIDYFPCVYRTITYSNWIKLRFTLLSTSTTTAAAAADLAATFKCRLVDQSNLTAKTFGDVTLTATFTRGKPEKIYLVSRSDAAEFVRDDALLIECDITVLLLDTAPVVVVAAATPSPPRRSDLQEHFGEMLASKKGADVTFLVAGEPVAAHRCVLAARSPVFMAELFGNMKEKDSSFIEINDMDADVFRRLLYFIYTDMLPDEDDDDVARMTMSHRLLEAADRYGMEKLKLICAERLQSEINVDNVSTALVLAERHGCTKLKARCIKFMVTGDNLHAVAATEGYDCFYEV